jgi:membrane-associated protein
MSELIQTYGYLGVFLAGALDHSGTPLGVMLSIAFVTSGDLLLFPTLVISILGALSADLVFYFLGYFATKKIFKWINTRNDAIDNIVKKTKKMLKKYGPMFLVWCRFIPFLGRYFSVVFGSVHYNFAVFIIFTMLGNILITLGFGLPTYFLGNEANKIFQNPYTTLWFILGTIVLQVVGAWLWFKLKKRKKRLLNF